MQKAFIDLMELLSTGASSSSGMTKAETSKTLELASTAQSVALASSLKISMELELSDPKRGSGESSASLRNTTDNFRSP